MSDDRPRAVRLPEHRFTDRSRIVLFHVGSICRGSAPAAGGGVEITAGIDVDRHRLVVATPDGDRRVMPQDLHSDTRLSDRLPPDTAG